MDKNKLDLAEVKNFLETLAKSDGVKKIDYEAPKEVKLDEAKSVEAVLKGQIPRHRTLLLILVFSLTIASFLLLVGIIVFQMFWRINHPNYTGISDAVINTLSVGVFAELVGVIGIIVKLVWKNP